MRDLTCFIVSFLKSVDLLLVFNTHVFDKIIASLLFVKGAIVDDGLNELLGVLDTCSTEVLGDLGEELKQFGASIDRECSLVHENENFKAICVSQNVGDLGDIRILLERVGVLESSTVYQVAAGLLIP